MSITICKIVLQPNARTKTETKHKQAERENLFDYPEYFPIAMFTVATGGRHWGEGTTINNISFQFNDAVALSGGGQFKAHN